MHFFKRRAYFFKKRHRRNAYLCIFGRGKTAARKSPVVPVVLVALGFAINMRARAREEIRITGKRERKFEGHLEEFRANWI